MMESDNKMDDVDEPTKEMEYKCVYCGESVTIPGKIFKERFWCGFCLRPWLEKMRGPYIKKVVAR